MAALPIVIPDGGAWPERLHGRLAVITGGSSGIGSALAQQLAEAGASVIVGSRRPVLGRVEHRELDLASKASTAEFAHGLLREGRPIDLLILNAGVHVPWKEVRSADGLELHWQVNFLANVLLAELLLPLCRRSLLRRIVSVASEAHRLAALRAAPGLGFWRRYAESKEAGVTFFLQFQELHPELRVRIVSPGYVDSAVHQHKRPLQARLERAWSRPRAPKAAAREILDCIANDSQAVYWDRGRPRQPGRRTTDLARAAELWRAALEQLKDVLPEAHAPQLVSNHAATFRALGPQLERPGTLGEVARVVREAARDGKSVRIVGRRHSYNDGFYSRSCMISLEHLDRILALDAERGTVSCEAGVSIGALCAYLDERGFALRYCGNYGKQTLAGALATGTHGYGRDGAVMSELIRAVTLLLPDGSLLHTDDERDLRALRLSVGALGAVVRVTLAVESIGPCRYTVACMPREEFTERLDEMASGNEYLRFVPHPFDERSVMYVTINRLPDGTSTRNAPYLNDAGPGAARLLAPALRIPELRSLVGRALRLSRHSFTLDVPFSSLLFIRSGVLERHLALARAGQLALERHDWLNMELAVPRGRYAEFERLFEAERPRLPALCTSRPYFTCRVAGAASNVLLAPNYDRDVVFCDVHVDQAQPTSLPFLRRLEAVATSELQARPHWGKLFFAEAGTLRGLYPAQNVSDFLAAKRRFDPNGVFSNDYTRRTLGV